MSGYDYPPSQHIMRYGPLQEGAHFYVRGAGTFDVGEVECDFEIAFTQECRVVIACYLHALSYQKVFLVPSNSPNSFFQMMAPRQDEIKCYGFIGKEVRDGRLVTVENPLLITRPVPVLPPIFSASRFRCVWDDTAQEDTPSLWQFSITGIDEGFSGQTFAGLRPDHREDATFEVVRKIEARDYDSQTTAELLIKRTNIPDGWTAENIADLWCALMSLVCRRDVQWTTQCVLNTKGQCAERIWQRRTVMGKWLHSGRFPVSGIQVIDFIEKIFSSVFSGKVTQEETASCVDLIRHYVFSLLTTNVAENQGRLIAPYIEAFLLRWEETNAPPEKILTKSERKRLLELLTTTIQANAGKFLDGYSEEDKTSQERLAKVLEKIDKDMEYVRQIAFKDRLVHFFEYNKAKYGTEGATALTVPSEILQTFKNTRDGIVHVGTFRAKDIEGMRAEYGNMLMVLPLMVLSFFGYAGPLEDLSAYWQ